MINVYSVSTSCEKGVKKSNQDFVMLKDNFGIECDAHGGFRHRQVSFLAIESIRKMQKAGLDVTSGDFAENITTEGIDLCGLRVGDTLNIGDVAFIISQLGKVCHNKCSIYYQAGDCVMPKEGVFAIVKGSGKIKPGDKITLSRKSELTSAVITLSDKGSRNERVDTTGPRIIDTIKKRLKASFIRYDLIPDEKGELRSLLIDLSDTQKFDLIITNGSTGISPRDIAPDVTEDVIDKKLPGFEEAMRSGSFEKTPHALISRAVCGVRNESFILNLPGSPSGARENLEIVLPAIPHAIKKLQGDKTDCAKN